MITFINQNVSNSEGKVEDSRLKKCEFFESNGFCRFGDNCSNVHPKKCVTSSAKMEDATKANIAPFFIAKLIVDFG